MKELVKILKSKNLTICSCESFTGGLFSNLISNISGASQVFNGALVAYSNFVKTEILKINKTLIKNYGAISEQCAIAMAQKTQALFTANIAVSFTGNAGPSSQENKPKGLIFIAILINKTIKIEKLQLFGSRKHIRKQAVIYATKILKEALLSKKE